MQQFVAICTTMCANARKGRGGCISSMFCLRKGVHQMQPWWPHPAHPADRGRGAQLPYELSCPGWSYGCTWQHAPLLAGAPCPESYGHGCCNPAPTRQRSLTSMQGEKKLHMRRKPVFVRVCVPTYVSLCVFVPLCAACAGLGGT